MLIASFMLANSHKKVELPAKRILYYGFCAVNVYSEVRPREHIFRERLTYTNKYPTIYTRNYKSLSMHSVVYLK